jgi:uncharacterized damage-inducible protein DinB
MLTSEWTRRIRTEGLERIRVCLDRLSAEQVWDRPNDSSNAIGNLILHLAGNVRQWICAGIGGHRDVRDREHEFANREPRSRADLLDTLTGAVDDAERVIEALTKDALEQTYRVQCYTESGVSILIHVIEHFSYHVGQITWQTKALIDDDLGYYAGDDLNQTG